MKMMLLLLLMMILMEAPHTVGMDKKLHECTEKAFLKMYPFEDEIYEIDKWHTNPPHFSITTPSPVEIWGSPYFHLPRHQGVLQTKVIVAMDP